MTKEGGTEYDEQGPGLGKEECEVPFTKTGCQTSTRPTVFIRFHFQWGEGHRWLTLERVAAEWPVPVQQTLRHRVLNVSKPPLFIDK